VLLRNAQCEQPGASKVGEVLERKAGFPVVANCSLGERRPHRPHPMHQRVAIHRHGTIVDARRHEVNTVDKYL
jgi:hypothetical protein